MFPIHSACPSTGFSVFVLVPPSSLVAKAKMTATGAWHRVGTRWAVSLPSDADVRRGHTVLVRSRDGKLTSHKVKEFLTSEGELSYFLVGPEIRTKAKVADVQNLLDEVFTTTGVSDLEDIGLGGQLDLLESRHDSDSEKT